MLGPLSRHSEPHAYDLCREHASRMTPPRGWELLRVAGGEQVSDDLVALADAVSPRSAAVEATSTGGSSGPTAELPAGDGRSSRSTRGTRPGDEGDSSPARHLHVVRSTHD